MNDLEATLASFTSRLSEAEGVCARDGHQAPFFPDVVGQMWNSGGVEVVAGYCGYCLGTITRGVSQDEGRTYVTLTRAVQEPVRAG